MTAQIVGTEKTLTDEELKSKPFKDLSKRMIAGFLPGSNKVGDKYLQDISKPGTLLIKDTAKNKFVTLMPYEVDRLIDFLLKEKNRVVYWLQLSREAFQETVEVEETD